jgi:hypothetical protein
MRLLREPHPFIHMQDTINAEENSKNIYVIKHKLSELRLKPGMNCYNYQVGKFIVRIFTTRSKRLHSTTSREYDRITQHEEVRVNLYETKRLVDTHMSVARDIGTYENPINIMKDERFQAWTLTVPEPFAHSKMTVIQLCELIKYLYRLSNLTAFL